MRDDMSAGDGESRNSGAPKGCAGCVGILGFVLVAAVAYGAFWLWRHEQRVAESKRYFLEKGKKVVAGLLAPTLTEDKAMLGKWLADASGATLPQGYDLAGGFSWFLFGKGFRVVFMLPKGQKLGAAMRCVDVPGGSGKKKVLLTLGPKTAFLVCKLFKDKQENLDEFVEDLIRKGGKDRDPKVLSRELLEVDVGGRKAKAAMQVFVKEGKVVRSVIVGLKPNVVLAGYGKDKDFDEAAFLAICRSVKN